MTPLTAKGLWAIYRRPRTSRSTRFRLTPTPFTAEVKLTESLDNDKFLGQ